MESGINQLLIAQTPVAIIDFETTGLTAGLDRVVEVSVVRVDPDQKPRLVLDTLVNPNRPMGATEIHGITDADVQQAPKFSDIADEVLAVTAGCVVAAYNVYCEGLVVDASWEKPAKTLALNETQPTWHQPMQCHPGSCLLST